MALVYDAVNVFYQGLTAINLDKHLTVERVDCKADGDTWTDGQRFYDILKQVLNTLNNPSI